MINAKEEFIRHTAGEKVLCAKLLFGGYDVEEEERLEEDVCLLIIGHTKEEYNAFLKKIDRRYDDGYGSQELYGYIWYEDLTYSERYEYDGSECWSHKRPPEIPFVLFKRKSD